MTARTLRLGMVGGGRGAFIGAVHRMAARLDGHWELVAGALASEPARALESGRDLGLDPARTYPDYAAMAAQERDRPDPIDAVAIVTPNDSHFAIAHVFLAAGFHVVCDKPMTTRLEDARTLMGLVEESGRVFVLTHNYAGYPMVRQARAMCRSGALGAIRVVQVEYPQDWLAETIEASGQKQAAWRVDPARAGIAGSLGDLGTHAHHLLRFVTGLEVARVSADLARLVPGRRLDDHAQVMLRLSNGARGLLWASQVCPGNRNALRLRVYGEKAGLDWSQERPDELLFTPLGAPPQTLFRGGPGLDETAVQATRLPPGHPEGYIEAFARLYADAAELIRAKAEGRRPSDSALLAPGVRDGALGVKFIEACVASSAAEGRWTDAAL